MSDKSPRHPLLNKADAYYAIAHDLERESERFMDMARALGEMADRMCEQAMRETAPKGEANG
jgi:hypothetical protein